MPSPSASALLESECEVQSCVDPLHVGVPGIALQREHPIVDACAEGAGEADFDSASVVQQGRRFLIRSQPLPVNPAACRGIKLEPGKAERLNEDVARSRPKRRSSVSQVLSRVRVLEFEADDEQADSKGKTAGHRSIVAGRIAAEERGRIGAGDRRRRSQQRENKHRKSHLHGPALYQQQRVVSVPF